MESKTHEEGMTLNDYQKRAMTTCTESCENFTYMMLNLVGEVGEFASKVAKAIRKNDGWIDVNRLAMYVSLPVDHPLMLECDEMAKLHGIDSKEMDKACDAVDNEEKRLTIEAMHHLKLEAGDILWQLSGLCSTFGWSLEEIAQMNLDKLASRKQRDKIIGDGDDR